MIDAWEMNRRHSSAEIFPWHRPVIRDEEARLSVATRTFGAPRKHLPSQW